MFAGRLALSRFHLEEALAIYASIADRSLVQQAALHPQLTSAVVAARLVGRRKDADVSCADRKVRDVFQIAPPTREGVGQSRKVRDVFQITNCRPAVDCSARPAPGAKVAKCVRAAGWARRHRRLVSFGSWSPAPRRHPALSAAIDAVDLFQIAPN
jgi:hypothetical protein